MIKEKQKRTEERLAIFIRPLQARSVQPVEATYISAEERPLTRAFIYGDMEIPGEIGLPGQVEVPFEPEEITIQLVQGDITQIDLPPKVKSGLEKSVRILSNIEGIGHVVLDEEDVVRHKLVKAIIKAYDREKLKELQDLK